MRLVRDVFFAKGRNVKVRVPEGYRTIYLPPPSFRVRLRAWFSRTSKGGV